MGKWYQFPCGCKWPVLEEKPPEGVVPFLDLDTELAPEDCPATWAMLGQGLAKGVFQLESPLGRQWTKKLKPESFEHMSALGALLRPGCIGGDTKVAVSFRPRSGRALNCKKVAIRDLYKQFTRQHFHYQKGVVSVDEDSCKLFNNELCDVTYSGEKNVYRVRVKTGYRSEREGRSFYNLECTLDHKLWAHNLGWVELKDLRPGDRIAVFNNRKKERRSDRSLKLAPGEKYFRDVCWLHYEAKCVLCEWRDGSLDVNHLRGNRKKNNSPGNLCFLCPNHHRVYTEGWVSAKQLEEARREHELPHTDHVMWVEYAGRDYVGVKDTYDISVDGPNHNFIAGNFVVHNCLKAVDEDGVSMTQHYVRRRHDQEPVRAYHPAIDAILFPTYGVLTYQEQAMAIAVAVAGFTEQEADMLRKAIGKKLPEEMAKCKKMFAEGAKRAGILSDEQSVEVFGWIEKSQRYSFNKSHSTCYGVTGYHSAYIKAHHPVAFFTSWLRNAKHKQDPQQEVFELVNDARVFDITVEPPDLRSLEPHYHTDRKVVKAGLADIKGIGDAQIAKLRDAVGPAEAALGKRLPDWDWYEFLVFFSRSVTSSVVTRLIQVGALRWTGLSRSHMEAEFKVWDELTAKEREWVKSKGVDAFGRSFTAALRALANPKKKPPDKVKGRVAKKGHEQKVERLEFELAGLDPADTAAVEAKAAELEKLTKWASREVPGSGYDGPEGGCSSDARRRAVLSHVELLENPRSARADTPVQIAYLEEELLGISITCCRVDSCDTSQVNCTCKEFLAGRTGFMMLAVEVGDDVREYKTKSGKRPGSRYGRMTVSDGTCALEAVAWPETWKEYGHLLNSPGNMVIVQAERDFKDKDSSMLIIKKAWQATQADNLAA